MKLILHQTIQFFLLQSQISTKSRNMLGTNPEMDYGVYNQIDQAEKPAIGSLSNMARVQFIRKVYTILCMQLVFTALVSIVAIYSDSFLTFQINNVWLVIVALITTIVCEIYILCCDGGRTHPNNMIALGIFTLAESYIVSFICSLTAAQGGKGIVMTAALMTIAMVVACTYYAFTTETDFTTSWGLVMVLSGAMLVLLIVNIFTTVPFLHTLYCFIGVVLFGLYLIIDTQMLIGRRSLEYTMDDHVVAAMSLYIDIIQIFLYILDLLSSSNNN